MSGGGIETKSGKITQNITTSTRFVRWVWLARQINGRIKKIPDQSFKSATMTQLQKLDL